MLSAGSWLVNNARTGQEYRKDAALMAAAPHANLGKLVVVLGLGADGFVGHVADAALDAVVNAVVAG